MTADQFRRAVLAFPDEDVLIGTRFIEPGAFVAFDGLEDICPRPGHKASGEERAWSRRLAKRFGAEGRINDRSFVVEGDGNPIGMFDYSAAPGDDVPAEVTEFFAPLDRSRGDVLIAFGWGMAEDLASRYGLIRATGARANPATADPGRPLWAGGGGRRPPCGSARPPAVPMRPAVAPPCRSPCGCGPPRPDPAARRRSTHGSSMGTPRQRSRQHMAPSRNRMTAGPSGSTTAMDG